MKWSLLLVLALSAVLACACSSSGTCSSSCSGCCDSSNFCHSGTESGFCGKGGVACASCGSGQCSAQGSCADAGRTCTSANCTGCCSGNYCLAYPQQSLNACGTGGAACQACSGGSQTCQSGACVSGCGTANCGGCCTGASCIPLNSQGGSQTTSQCGYGGAVCQACPSGQICSPDGLCVLPNSGGDGGPTYDFPCGPNAPCSLSQQCCTSFPDGGTQFACVNSCSSSSDVISCDGPEECLGGGAPICCGVEVLTGGSWPSCSMSQLGASCQASCPTNIVSGCVGTNQVIICHTSQDCSSDPNHNQCCLFNSSGAQLTFCVDSSLAFWANQCF